MAKIYNIDVVDKYVSTISVRADSAEEARKYIDDQLFEGGLDSITELMELVTTEVKVSDYQPEGLEKWDIDISSEAK